MSKNKNTAEQRFETKAIHIAGEPDKETGARFPALHQAVSFVFKDTKHAADVFSLKTPGYIYSRANNPTVNALETRIAALEGGTAATATASGLGAQMLIFSALLNSGDEYVASNKMYGGTLGQIRDTFTRSFGWNAHLVDPSDVQNFKNAITPKTKFIFVESLSNPEGVIPDLEGLGKIAKEAGIPLIVDNTVASPYLCRPIEFGANIVTHSTTKYMNGHGNALGGVVVDGGNFDWMKYKEKFPTLTEPNLSYRGLVFAEDFADAPMAVYNHGVSLRDLGNNQQPMNAWLTLMGLETLALRMERHCENAQKVAEYLSKHKDVAWVNYGGLESSPYYERAQKYMRNGWASSLFTFGLKGGYNAGVKVVENAKLFSHLANIGDSRSLIIHPASTTHAQLTDGQKILAGAAPDVVRISVGIEHIDDIIADLEQAIEIASNS
jgi:O-acetylhomoserine (thiol)-lyase